MGIMAKQELEKRCRKNLENDMVSQTRGGKSFSMLNSNSPSLQEVFDKIPDSILVTDAMGTIVLANQAAAKIVGMAPTDLIGQNTSKLVQQGWYSKSLALEAAKGKTNVTGIIENALGQTFVSTSVPLLDENGEVRFIISNSRNKEMVEGFIRGLERTQSELVHLRNREAEKKSLTFCSQAMQRVVEKAQIAAGVSCPVLLLGESGVGKDVVANYIHRTSTRAKEAFIVINCAAMPENLIESELFGYAKGAFSGANVNGKFGLVELADKGTLFLDEIAEIPLALQAKFLRVLETYELRRLGSVENRKIEFRLIAATNRDLKGLVAQGKFREDLYYRLSVFPFKIPPVRERREDIPALVDVFLAEFNKKYGTEKRMSPAAFDSVMTYDWPGNVRELRNAVERRFFSTPGEIIQCTRRLNRAETITAEVPVDQMPVGDGRLREVLQRVETAYIKRVLRESGGHSVVAAKRLGIHRSVLWRKIQNMEG